MIYNVMIEYETVLNTHTFTMQHLLYKAEKPSVRLSVCPSAVFGTLITQECLHRFKRGLLEMKAVSLENAKFILISV